MNLLPTHGILRKQRFGSSIVPGVVDPKDEDWLIQVKSYDRATVLFERAGFRADASDVYTDSPFISMRRDKVNLIITTDGSLYNMYSLACRLCVAAAVTDKPTRVLVHNALAAYRNNSE